MIEIALQITLFILSIFATGTLAMQLLLMRKSRVFSAWAGIFLGFVASMIAELLKIFLGYTHYSVWILSATAYLLIAIGFIYVYRFTQHRELSRQRRQKIASLVADTRTMVDPVTRLANRRQLEARTQVAFQMAVENKKSIALIALKIDDFKGKFYTYGQECADEILRTFAASISSTIREAPRGNDVAARIDSDEFQILLVGANAAIARTVSDRLLMQIQLNPLNWQNQFIHLNAMIGFTAFPQESSFQTTNNIATPSPAQLLVTVEDTLDRACQMGPGTILQGPV